MDHDTQEGILSFPFDHIYACHADNVEVSIPSDSLLHNIQNEQAQNEILQLSDKLSDAQKEICHLKDLILIHLDLIQQQSDELIQKDKQITLYLKEIEKLKLTAIQPENTLNFHIQNLTPPPLIQLAPAQARVFQEGTSQVQIANLRGLIATTDSKTYDIKQDVPETYTCYSTITNKDPLPFANVGTLIDARFLQCSDASFVDNQQGLCLQPVIQPVIQPVLQPLTIQTSLQSVVQPIATSVQPRLQTVQPLVQTVDQVISPINQFKTVPMQMNKVSPLPVSIIEDTLVSQSTSDFYIKKDNESKLSDNMLTTNKNCKALFTYENNPKKIIRKCQISNPVTTFHTVSKQTYKSNELFTKSLANICEEKPPPMAIKVRCISPVETKPKPIYSQFSNTNENKACKNHNQKPLVVNNNENVSGRLTPVKVIKQEKVMPPRKFFTTGHKEKVSCRDFSYGETMGNINKYIKSDILEYLEGNNSNSQTDIDIIETNTDDKFNSYLSKIFHSTSPTPFSDDITEPLDVTSIIDIKTEDKDDEEVVKDILESQPVEDNKIDLYDFQSSEEFDSNTNQFGCNLVYMSNVMTDSGNMSSSCGKMPKKRNFRTTSMCLPSQSMDSMLPTTAQQMLPYKSNANRKRNVRRKRALSSASKLSNLSHGESPLPYSWSFSGQDFKMLSEDIKTDYFTGNFGTNPSFFTIDEVNQSKQGEQTPTETASLEVPSWRIKCYSPDACVESNENVDEELFLKRHSKMEMEEKRRKRWDFQMIREQRHIERLKQRQERRNSSSYKPPSRSSKCLTSGFEELPQSLYPTVDDIFSIEIRDTLPLTAFGECIPDVNLRLPPRHFNLPWCHSKSHSSRKRIKLERLEDE